MENQNNELSTKVVNEVFQQSKLKVTQDDPAVSLYLALHEMMKTEIEQYQKEITAFSDVLVNKVQLQLDNSNEYFVGNSSLLLENLEEKFNQLLSSLDDKNKDLNFVLAKIQGDYDKLTDERFEAHFKKIADEQAKTIKQLQTLHDENLKRQRKIDTSKQRDVLMGGCGFVVGLIVCLLVFFIVK